MHVVKQGQCLAQIAATYGFADYRVVYGHPDNAALRKKRPNPNVLLPGDQVAIPDLEVKTFSCATGASHRFKITLPKKVLRVVLLDGKRKPLASESYTLTVAGMAEPIAGKTDGNGLLKENVSPMAQSARVAIADRVVQLRFGSLDPVGDLDAVIPSGVNGRLQNLGYDVDPSSRENDPSTRAALALFQSDNDIELSGNPDAATLDKLASTHGC